jgi:hypothetical protein
MMMTMMMMMMMMMLMMMLILIMMIMMVMMVMVGQHHLFLSNRNYRRPRYQINENTNRKARTLKQEKIDIERGTFRKSTPLKKGDLQKFHAIKSLTKLPGISGGDTNPVRMLQSISNVGPREAASNSAMTFAKSGILKARNAHIIGQHN